MSDALDRKWPTGTSMGRRIRSVDWAPSALGPIDTWDEALKHAVDIMLRLPMPALLAWGEAGTILYNDACLPYSKTFHPDLLGSRLDDCWAAEPEFAVAMRKVFRHGNALTWREREFALNDTGRIAPAFLQLNFSPVPGKDGKAAGALAVVIDMSHRLRAERVLREREQRLSAIFSRAQVGLCVISPDGKFRRVNAELCRMLGRSQEQLQAMRIQDVTQPDDLERSLKAVQHMLETGESMSLDKRYVRPDGSVVFANSILTRLDHKHDSTHSVLAVTVDLTQRRHAEQALAESEARFRALAEASPAVIWQLDADGSLMYLNQRQLELSPVPTEQLLGVGWRALLHPDDSAHCIDALSEAVRERLSTQCRARFLHKEGQWRWVESHASPWFTATGQYAGHVGISIDVDDAVRAQEELRISNERLNLAIEGSGDGVWDWNIQSGEIVSSERTREILDLNGEEVRYEDWVRNVHPDDLANVLAVIQANLKNTTPAVSVEYRVRRPNGSWRWILARAVVVRRDESGQPLRMTGTLTDISEKRYSEEVIWHHANFDLLTQLPNRRLFRDRLDQELQKAARSRLPLALLFIDLDRFKEANDLLGHDVGDQILIEAARRIRACVRTSDTVARLGGDEFTAILPELDDLAHVDPIAQKINDALLAPFHVGQEMIYLSGSIGITLYPADARKADDLIRNADQAMYVAKNGGRNQFNYFTPSMQREAHHRLRLIADLRSALDQGELAVYYQPVVDLANGRAVKAEALLRWHHPRLGLIEPVHFISLAEESGLITEIGDWVFREAASHAQRWSHRHGAPFQVSVNKSPVQFLARSRAADWPAYLEDMGMSGGCVSVEITEGLLLNASPCVADKLMQYRDAGIQVALDDFGTGYSSMAYLQKFDIDYLKIDQSFVRDMVTNDGDRAIVRSVTAMAHELGLQVIAEGIETDAQRELLAEAGCDFGQGFLFSRPVPPAALEQRLWG